MSEAKHTPGPWQQDGSHIYGPDPQRTPVCQMIYPGRGYQEEAAANESLLKAAPAMLSALKSLRNEISGIIGVAREEIRCVISNTNLACLELRIAEAETAIARAERRNV